MKIQLIIFIASLLFLSTTCKEEADCHETIIFKNNSSKSLYIHASGSYPDTTSFEVEFPNPALNKEIYKVAAYSKNTSALWYRSCLEFTFKSNDTLMIFVFDANVLETIPWDTIKSKHLVLKRYNLSLEDLEQMNWKLIYE